MNWMRLLEVTVAAGIVSTFSDYFLAGDWLHKRFAYQEVWRTPARNWAMALIAPLPFLTSGAFAVLASRLDIHSIRSAMILAAAIWVIGPLPLILTSAAYIKLRGFFVASYAFAWLVRLMIVAVLAARFLR
jgi:hypothetical protein